MDHLYRRSDKLKHFCSQHQAKFTSLAAYEKHQKCCRSLLLSQFVCCVVSHDRICGKISESATEQILHARDVHSRYLCSECGLYFETMAELNNHEHIFKDALKSKWVRLLVFLPFYVRCKIYFLSLLDPIKCIYCVCTFKEIGHYKVHITAKHSAYVVRPKRRRRESLECERCGKNFGQQSHLTRHMKIHLKRSKIYLDENIEEVIVLNSSSDEQENEEEENNSLRRERRLKLNSRSALHEQYQRRMEAYREARKKENDRFYDTFLTPD